MSPEEVAAHAAQVERWRAARLAALRQPRGWLSLCGLDWLAEGDQQIGSDAGNDIVLPSGPRRAGVLRVEGGAVTLLPAPGANWKTGGGLVDAALPLRDDAVGDPTLLELGALRLVIIRRGARLAVRTWNTQAELLERFDGIPSYPVDPRWRIEARFEAGLVGRTIDVPDVTGVVAAEASPGAVVFTADGREHRLDALAGGERGELWLVFGDRTNGKETYAGGRFLYTDAPARDGRLVVDFNRAYNPPCVFSPYATCPLPPDENRLDLAVEAGERAWTPSDSPGGAAHCEGAHHEGQG